MPQKNTIRLFVADGFYHVYNRGVNKGDIFFDDQDHRVFLHLLKYYLSPIQSLDKEHPLTDLIEIVRPRPIANLEKEVDLVAYCLMPNHFHLLLKQNTVDGMTKLMRRVTTTFVLYMNKRHRRVGHLFQAKYKAALIEDEPYLLHVSRYIHTNPLALSGVTRSDLVKYPYSSYPYYLGHKRAPWIKPQPILDFFQKTKSLPLIGSNSYQAFVETLDFTYPKAIFGLLLDTE